MLRSFKKQHLIGRGKMAINPLIRGQSFKKKYCIHSHLYTCTDVYTHSYSFNTDISLHVHSAVPYNNYPYNPKFVGNIVNRTRDPWLDKCIQASSSTT